MQQKSLLIIFSIFYTSLLPGIRCLRIVQLKNSDKYLINNSGVLGEETTTLDNIENQYVVIHNRILYFYKNNKYFTLAQPNKDINVKIIESNFHTDRNVEFLESRTVVDAFSLGPDKKEGSGQLIKQTQIRHDTEKTKHSMPLRHPRPSNVQRFSENKRIASQRIESQQKEQKNNELTDYGDNSQHSNENRPGRGYNYNEENDIVETKVFNSKDLEKSALHEHIKSDYTPYNEHILDDETLPTEEMHKKKDHSHFIESDSSMEDTIDGCLFKDVVVQEVDSNYFQLVASHNICVTSFDNKFIFASCSKKNEKQQFTMVRADEVLRKLKNTIKNDNGATKPQTIANLTPEKTESSAILPVLNRQKPSESNVITSIKTQLVPVTVTVTKKHETKSAKQEKLDDAEDEQNEIVIEKKKKKDGNDASVLVFPPVKPKSEISDGKKQDSAGLDSFLSGPAPTNEDDDFLSRMQSMFSLSDIGINNLE